MSEQIPKIVCLCGSTRFKETFDRINEEETLKGHIVLAPGYFGHQKKVDLITDEQKAALDDLHHHKIDMADEVIFINENGYMGESTLTELDYAMGLGKQVRFTSPRYVTDAIRAHKPYRDAHVEEPACL